MADNVIETGRSRIEDILLKASNGEALSRIEEILLELYNDIVHLGPDGLIPAELIPPQVFERMIPVADDTARFALTTDDVQNGDWVYVNSTQSIYYVYDDTNLDSEDGYKPVAAGIAAKAIADQYGNVIDTTYAKNTDLDALTAKVGTNENNILSIDKEVNLTYTDNILQDTLWIGATGITKNKNVFTLNNYTIDSAIDYLFRPFNLAAGDYTIFIKTTESLPKKVHFGIQSDSVTINQNVALPQGETFAYKNFTLATNGTITKASFYVWPAEDTFIYSGDITVLLVRGTYTDINRIKSIENKLNSNNLFSKCLIFEDDFDNDTLNNTVWGYELGEVRNNELQFYRKENISVENSCLVITAARESYKNHEWTSGSVTTAFNKYFKYGRYEARIKLPNVTGSFPAFWAMGNYYLAKYEEDSQGDVTRTIVRGTWSDCGEIDIMEQFGTSQVKSGVWNNNDTKATTYNYTVDTTQFHIYACEWTATEIKFFVDDILIGSQALNNSTLAAYNNYPFYLILNLAVGSSGGTPAAGTNEMKMYVDWVRVYSL